MGKPNRVIVRMRPAQRVAANKKPPIPYPHDLPSERWWKNGKRPQRDSFRQKCYDAEIRIRKRLGADLPEQRKFESLQEVERYLKDLVGTVWFQRRWPFFRSCQVTLQHNLHGAHAAPAREFRIGDRAFVENGRISFSLWSIGAESRSTSPGGEMVVLHELAHAIIPWPHRHDRRWARTFLDLVRFRMGKEVHDALRDEFKQRNVKFNPVRRVDIDQLAKARAAIKNPVVK